MQISDHYVHFSFGEMINVLSVVVPRVRDRQCLNTFCRKGRQDNGIRSFKIPYSSQRFSPVFAFSYGFVGWGAVSNNCLFLVWAVGDFVVFILISFLADLDLCRNYA